MSVFLKQMVADIKLPEMTISTVVSSVASFFIIFGGIVPFIPQYLQIKRSKDADGFSTFVCFTLIVANILRILFWFGHPFEIPLLLQSVIMIATMFAMVYICTAVKSQSEIIAAKPRSFKDSSASSHITEENGNSLVFDSGRSHIHLPLIRRTFWDFDREYFWRWTDFQSYIQFMCLFTLLCGAVTFAFLSIRVYVETLGFLAVFFEAMLGSPQFYRNYQNKSTKGMSIQMVLCWLSGDIFKTIYFLLRSAPMQFWLCGLLQVSLDIAILGQVVYYGSQGPHRILKEAVQ